VQAMVQQSEESSANFEDRREALAVCVKKLTEKQVALLQAYYTANQTLREIAEASGRSLSAVKMTLLRIRRQLATCIERQMRANA
jgi:RNA polymerase sigma-70 factor (ECF subfamily)